ncbi:MAG: histidine kinase dimerization/phospho-acceptor domain-containing protein, partial [Bacteroidota bacterium]
MKKGSIRFIVIFTAIALAGLILTQTIWIIKAIKVGTEHFNHRANLTLEDVLDELVIYAEEKYQDIDSSPGPGHLFGVLDTNLVDTLMRKYIHYHKLGNNYGYQIVKTANDSVIYESRNCLGRTENTVAHKACLSCLWNEEYFHIALFFPTQSNKILWEMSTWLIVSGIFLLTIVFTFGFTLHNLLKQKRLSDMKNDFINNMSHEFKTPISTIALTSEILKSVEGKNERLKKYATIIHEENNRLQDLFDRVLQLAQLEREEIKLNVEEIHLNNLIKNTVHNLCL